MTDTGLPTTTFETNFGVERLVNALKGDGKVHLSDLWTPLGMINDSNSPKKDELEAIATWLEAHSDKFVTPDVNAALMEALRCRAKNGPHDKAFETNVLKGQILEVAARFSAGETTLTLSVGILLKNLQHAIVNHRFDGSANLLKEALTEIHRKLTGDHAAFVEDVLSGLDNSLILADLMSRRWTWTEIGVARRPNPVFAVNLSPLVLDLGKTHDMHWLEQWFATQPLHLRLALPEDMTKIDRAYDNLAFAQAINPDATLLICNPFGGFRPLPRPTDGVVVFPPMSGCPHSRTVPWETNVAHGAGASGSS
jgi:hypothetical protein